jgi:formylglycine-generating enzyme required for sulfatase activity
MPVLFVSHSSKDDTAVSGLEEWLKNNGFTDFFIDHNNIAGGDKWREALRASAGACRVIVCLVSKHWLASQECFGEFVAACYMGKRIIPLFLFQQADTLDDELKRRFAKVCAEDQGIKLDTCLRSDGVLDLTTDSALSARLKDGLRAAGALNEVGLDPQAYTVDRKLRPIPFPGLASFGDDDADAALFYGRSRELAETLEELRKMRAERDVRPFVILGASGAGKSSLLKAGIIPRLRREAPAWLPLRAFRPGADPLLRFAESLARTLFDYGKIEAHGHIRDRLFTAWSQAEREENGLSVGGFEAIEKVLEEEGLRLRGAASCESATILISVDQAEELARAEADGSAALVDYLRVAAASSRSSWQIAFTIRTDSFPELQRDDRFRNLRARAYDLRAVPVFRFESIVVEPAKRYGVVVDHGLVDALMADAPKDDALPLLAFALQRLWRQYAASNALKEAYYEKVGGLKGLIEDAAERALRAVEPGTDEPMPPAPSKRLVDLAQSTFVPALAQVNEHGAAIRRVADWDSFDHEQQELLARFDRWRLVVRKSSDVQGGSVEVAHEALFREWSRLKEWFEPERARLETLRSVQVAAATWERHGRDAGFLDHRSKRLAEGSALEHNEVYRARLSTLDVDYLATCRKVEFAALNRARRVRASVYLLLIGIIAGLLGWINQEYLKEQVKWYAVVRPYKAANIDPYVLTASAERSLKPEDHFRECARDCPEMIVIPAGSFLMGSPPTSKERSDNESPQHQVTISRPFAVSKFPVTFAEWDTCVAMGDCDPQIGDATWGRGTRPAIYVTWLDAQRYVAWLKRMTGKPYRLLTEAEFEYATRAGTRTVYPWGDELGTRNANCIGCGSEWDAKQTSPVGSFAPNGYGLYDMVGNVSQWVEDCYHPTYENAPVNGSAWSSRECPLRVVRGSSWFSNPGPPRSAVRGWGALDRRNSYLGFRVGRTLEP